MNDCNCGKVCYTKKEAQQQRNIQRQRGLARDLEIYYCKHGNCWHLSHKKFSGFDQRGRRFRK